MLTSPAHSALLLLNICCSHEIYLLIINIIAWLDLIFRSLRNSQLVVHELAYRLINTCLNPASYLAHIDLLLVVIRREYKGCEVLLHIYFWLLKFLY